MFVKAFFYYLTRGEENMVHDLLFAKLELNEFDEMSMFTKFRR